MTSSLHEVSDNSGEADELQKHREPLNTSLTPAEISHPGVPAPSVQYVTPPPLRAVNTMGQAAYPYPDPYYQSVFAPYDAHSYPAVQPYPAAPMAHLQLMGIQQAGVLLPSDAIEEPVFVNAKQYHGIMRRRQSRAKAESESKLIKSRKPYLHESRHLHALRRARGNGGRFLNAKKNENQKREASSEGKKSLGKLNLNDRNDLASSAAVERFPPYLPENKVCANHNRMGFSYSHVDQGLS